jgi:hypothetical protein
MAGNRREDGALATGAALWDEVSGNEIHTCSESYSSSDKESCFVRTGAEASAGFSGQRARPAKASSPEDYLNNYVSTCQALVTPRLACDFLSVMVTFGGQFFANPPSVTSLPLYALFGCRSGRFSFRCGVGSRGSRFSFRSGFGRGRGLLDRLIRHFVGLRRAAQLHQFG